MKKLFLLLGLGILLYLPAASYAASIGGAETVGQGNFDISLSQDLIFGRDGEYDGGVELEPNETLEMSLDEQIGRTLVRGSYGLTEELDIYVMLGSSNFESTIDWTISEPGHTVLGKFELDGENGLVYGAGIKAIREIGDWIIIGGDIQYLTHKNDFDGVASFDGSSSESSLEGDADFEEWHIASYVAKRIGDFVPYLGGRYSSAKTEYEATLEGDEDTTRMNFESENNVGVFLGTTWDVTESWKLNVEGRFVDEDAVNFSVAYRF